MIYKDCRVYGPYKRKDNRQHICVLYPDGKRSTVSYPKYLVELKLNRHLETNETIHHINGDFTDNRFENLLILDNKEHAKLHSIERMRPDELHTCFYCGKDFIIPGNMMHLRKHKKKKSSGNFCSRRCSGLYGKEVQTNNAEVAKLVERESLKNFW